MPEIKLRSPLGNMGGLNSGKTAGEQDNLRILTHFEDILRLLAPRQEAEKTSETS
jgi:hypothetical protein